MQAVLLSAGAIRQHYPGPEGRAITKALHAWAQAQQAGHGQPPAADQESFEPTPPQKHNEQPVEAASMQSAATSHTNGGPSLPPAQDRALPGVLGWLINRPHSAGPSTTADTSQQQQQEPPVVTGQQHVQQDHQQQQPPQNGPSPALQQQQQQQPSAVAAGPAAKRCVVCGVHPVGWMVLVPCRHLGPCLHCLTPPPNAIGKLVDKPEGYPTCLVCNSQVSRVIRVLM